MLARFFISVLQLIFILVIINNPRALISNMSSEKTLNSLRREQLRQLAQNRSEAYGFLGTMYLEAPTCDLMKHLQRAGILQSIGMLTSRFSSEAEEVRKAVDDILCECRDTEVDGTTNDLAVEFTRLLRGVRWNNGPLPPYESLHVEGCVWGESTAEVLLRYRETGVALPERLKGEPPDHVGFELDFMRCLCEREAKIWKEGEPNDALKVLENEGRFLRKHLLNWIPEFCDTMTCEAKHSFYRGIAGMTKALVTSDESLVGILIRVMRSKSLAPASSWLKF